MKTICITNKYTYI